MLATAAGGLEALARCDVVVKTPGISRHRPEVAALDDAGVAVVGGLGLWMEEADLDRVVCITGPRARARRPRSPATCSSGLGYRCLVAGNIGRPPWDPAAGDDYDFWVVEVSSFQATDLASAPPVVAVTSLGPDHLDWHGDAEAYYADKLSLCTLPGAGSPWPTATAALAAGPPRSARRRGALGRARATPASTAPGPTRSACSGDHNRRNALIARALPGAPSGSPRGAGRPGGPGRGGGRLPRPREPAPPDRPRSDGVTFVDDSLSTNVLPTLAALEAFGGRRVALLVGGHDRGIDYRPLAEAWRRRGAPTLVLTLPDNGPRIRRAARGDGRARPPEVDDSRGPGRGHRAGFDWARPDGVVLLSPAAPSFGRFPTTASARPPSPHAMGRSRCRRRPTRARLPEPPARRA